MCQSVHRTSQSPVSREYCIFQPSYYATSMTTGYCVTMNEIKKEVDNSGNKFNPNHILQIQKASPQQTI